MSSRLLPLTPLGRACLMLAFLLLGSLAHASAMAGSAVDALSVHHSSPAHADHCVDPHCDGDAEPATQCCGGGPCAYIPGSPAIGGVPVEGALEHFVRVRVLMGRLPASIDRPPKAVRTKCRPHHQTGFS